MACPCEHGNKLCRISGFHSGDNKEFYILVHNAMQSSESQLNFAGICCLSLELKNEPNKLRLLLFHVGFLLELFFSLEDGGNTFP
jgi:hypothetical protein